MSGASVHRLMYSPLTPVSSRERPSGVELRFLLPQDVPIEPQGHTRADLVEGARVRVRVGHLERGMAVLRLVLEAAPSKP